jgi:hypothetical protein
VDSSNRHSKVVRPGGPGFFFKGDVQISPQPIEKLQDHARFRLNEAFHHDLANSIPDRYRNAVLVYIHTNIFSAGHLQLQGL